MHVSRKFNRVGRDDEPKSGERACPPWIIVAEPDDDTRCRVAGVLYEEGYTVLEAADGIELLDYLSAPLSNREIAKRPGLIMMSLWMPGVSGLAIMAGLRDADLPAPIVLLIDSHNRPLRRTYRHLGASAVLERPIDIEELRVVVCSLLPVATRIGDWSDVLQHTEPAQAIPDDTLAQTG